MKKIIIFFLVATSLVLMSYEKKKENKEINNIHVKNGINLAENIHIENGMLVFKDFDQYHKTIEVLAKEDEAFDDDFLKKWGHLKEDELDDKEDELKYNPDLVFLKFETQFKGFKSLRKLIKNKEEKWLDNEILDDKNDPDNHFVFDTEERAVLNTKAQVKIGKSIFQLTMFGDLEVTDGDIKTANLIHSQNALKLKLKNVIIHGAYDGTIDNSNTQATTTSTETSGSTATTGSTSTSTNPSQSCKTWLNKTSYYYYGRKKIKGYQKLTGYRTQFTPSKAKAKTRHFKKRRRRWRCRRGPIGVRLTGVPSAKYRLQEDICEDGLPLSKNKYRRRKRRVKVKDVIRVWDVAISTEQHKLKTEHRRNNSNNIMYFWN